MDYASIVAVAVPVGFFILFFVVVWSVMRALISRVFTDNYKELKRLYPHPVKRFRFLSGRIHYKSSSIQLKGSLKLDIYPDKLIASTLGKALCLDYFSYSFTSHHFMFYHSLVVSPLNNGEPERPPLPAAHGSFLESKLAGLMQKSENALLTVSLSKKNVDYILQLVQQARQSF